MTRTPRRAWAILALYLALLSGLIAYFALQDDETSGSHGSVPRALRFTATPAGDPFPNLSETLVLVGDSDLNVVIADDEAERGRGLRKRKNLGRYDGMLFVYEDDGERSFTMSTVPVPLDIGFYNAHGRLVNHLRMEPCAGSDAECPLYPSEKEFRYALETLAGDLPRGRLQSA